MPLHPVAQQLLDDAAASAQPNSHALPIAVARANFDDPVPVALPVEKIASFEDVIATTAAGQVPVRLYQPTTAGTVTPLVYFIHGGGWQMGSLHSHDGICRAVANAIGFAVLNAGYRQPPESKFPLPRTTAMTHLPGPSATQRRSASDVLPRGWLQAEQRSQGEQLRDALQ